MKVSFAFALTLLLALAAPVQAAALTPLPEQTLSFPAGKDVQPAAFSPDGSQLLTLDAAGLTLWQVEGRQPLWRSAARLDWFPWNVEWDEESITLRNYDGQQVRLNRNSGRELGQGRWQPPAKVLAGFGLKDAAGLRTLGGALWQEDPDQPLPFEVVPGKLVGYYAQSGNQLALKRPEFAPAELLSSGKMQYQLQTIFPAASFGGPDNRFAPGLSFSPDGRWLAWSSRRRVTLWNVRSGEKVAVLRPDPYGPDSDDLRMVWSPAGDVLSVYSMRDLWRYRTPTAGQQAAAFTLLDHTPTPKDALIRTVSALGTLTSGTGAALLLSQAGSTQAQAVGPVPQRVFFGEDGQTTLAVAWPFVWVLRHGAQSPLALRLPDYAEAEWLTLQGERLTVYGRNLGWIPGQEPSMRPSVWTADLPAASTPSPLPLTLQQEDPHPNCGPQQTGQWATAVIQPVRLCQTEKQLSGYRKDEVVWSLELPDAAQPFVTPDGLWFALRSDSKLRIYRSGAGTLTATVALPDLPKDTFWTPALRVDPEGRWAAVQGGQQWYLVDLRAGSVQALPALKDAQDLAFIENRLAVIHTDRVEWFRLE